jgi:hypothetical protein
MYTHNRFRSWNELRLALALLFEGIAHSLRRAPQQTIELKLEAPAAAASSTTQRAHHRPEIRTLAIQSPFQKLDRSNVGVS